MIPGSDLHIVSSDGAPIGRLAGPRGTAPRTWAISLDDRFLAAAFSDELVRIWDFQRQRRTIRFTRPETSGLAFSADLQRLLLGRSDGTISQWAVDVTALYPAAASRAGHAITAEERERFRLPNPTRLASSGLLDRDHQPLTPGIEPRSMA